MVNLFCEQLKGVVWLILYELLSQYIFHIDQIYPFVCPSFCSA